MTNISNDGESWEQIEDSLYGLRMDISHRCYPEHSATGARYMVQLSRRHLTWIDYALLGMDDRGAMGASCEFAMQGRPDRIQLTRGTTFEDIWKEIESLFDRISKTVEEGRSYPAQNVLGVHVQYLQWVIREDLKRIDYLLLCLDERAKKEHGEGES